MDKLTDEQIKAFEGALTLPEEYAEATDFDAEEAIKLDYSVKLPEFFSLWKWIYKTSNQGSLGACSSLSTTHSVQILNVKKGKIKPTDRNIITPLWKDLWRKMWHSTTQYDGWDYIEKAVKTALKEWILIQETWKLAKFDAYATQNWDRTDKGIELIKRYLYQWCPIVRCIRWNKTTWTEMTKGEVKTIPTNLTWAHCIALVGWDAYWFWFINSWTPNDDNKRKSRFFISYKTLKALKDKVNYRYRVLYIKEDAAKDPEYLKRKNRALVLLQALKKIYPEESSNVKTGIEALSTSLRNEYPELNDELPL